MKTNKPNHLTTSDLDRQSKLFMLASVLVLGITAIIMGLIIMLTNQQVKKIGTARQELTSLKETASSLQSLQSFAQNRGTEISKIATLFPNEDDFIYTLQEIETLVKNTDPQGTVKVSAAKPTKTQNQNTIPLTIHLAANPNSAINFLREFERLPYIIQIQNLEISSSQNLLDTFDMNLSVKLYVANPFSS